MEKLVINGNRKLQGEISVHGAKNSVLPILASTLLIKGVSIIHNVPDLTDVDASIRILEYLGAKVKRENDTSRWRSRQATMSFTRSTQEQK